MPGARISGLAIAEGIAGFVLFWSGLRNQTIANTFKDLLAGKVPADIAATPPTVGVNDNQPPSSSSGGGSTTTIADASSIAQDALTYVGKMRYVWGGAPDTGGTDCSGLVNWVCGHDLGLPIPGYAAGSYTGSTHGPVVSMWLASTLLTTVKSPQAGDIVCFGLDTHMGIMISATSMVSDENPQNGTRESGVQGFGSPITYRRYKASAGSVPPTG